MLQEVCIPHGKFLPHANRSSDSAAIFFTTYSTLKQNFPIDDTHPLNHLLAASVGEVAACLVRVPTEVVKSRTQTSAYGAGISSWGVFLRVAQAEGLRGLYRGFGSTVMREVRYIYIRDCNELRFTRSRLRRFNSPCTSSSRSDSGGL